MTHTEIAEPVTWQPYWRFAARAVKRAMCGRHKIRLLDDDYTVAYETRSASCEDDLPQIASLAEGKTCVFDVGANLGLTSLVIAKRLSTEGSVYAFDASESCCLVIRENATLNHLQNRIRVVNAVVAAGDCHIHSFNWNFVSGNASIVIPSLAGQQIPFFKASISLDNFAKATQTTPDFIKVDVEGAELQVLEGMRRILLQARPIVWMEYHSWPGACLQDRLNQSLEILSAVDYETLDPATGRLVVRAEQLVSSNHAPFARCHALLRPKDR